MAVAAHRFELPHERISRLHGLGLTEQNATEAIIVGLVKQRACTPLHPGNFAETVEWGETVFGWRTQLIPQGWQADEEGGLSRIVNWRLGIALIVATGCSNTGRRDRETQPRTKNTKGRAAGLAIEDNGQTQLFATLDGKARPEPGTLRSWYHLFSNDGRRVWHEISLPKGRDRAGHIVSWYERIICEPVEIAEIAERQTAGILPAFAGDSSEIDVSVERIR